VRVVTGCDVVDVARLAAIAERRPGFVPRVFTAAEVADCTRGDVELTSPTARARLAARFAAKEALRKATGDLRLPFHDVEVRRGPRGAPELHVRGAPTDWSCSLSHDAGVALAVVVGVCSAGRPTGERDAGHRPPGDRPPGDRPPGDRRPGDHDT
jgi:phosphopantetheine--protein transferase-like protein